MHQQPEKHPHQCPSEGPYIGGSILGFGLTGKPGCAWLVHGAWVGAWGGGVVVMLWGFLKSIAK